MMEKKEMAKILCTVDDTGGRIDVNVNCNGAEEYLLLAFSAIAKTLLFKDGISTRLLVLALMAKDLLPDKTDKDSGAEWVLRKRRIDI